MTAPPPLSPARVRVPCSTSNLGAGFDCVGVALDRWLDASVAPGEPGAGVTIDRRGTLARLAHVPAARDHLATGFRRACERRATEPPADLAFAVRSEIPVARGLGSSAAALVAGALLADAALALALTPDDVVAIGAEVEGHPDNVAPIVLGGAVLAVPAVPAAGEGGRGARYHCTPLDVHPSIAFALAVPDFETSTRRARAALPATVTHRDAVAAVGKSAALVRGLATADPVLLAHALDDLLHVPHRRSLVPGYDAVVAAARAAGAFGATLSGSGSTLLALAPPERAAAVVSAMCDAWVTVGAHAEGAVAHVAPGASLLPVP